MKWLKKTLGAAGGTLLVLGPLGTLGALDVGGIDVARAIWQTLAFIGAAALCLTVKKIIGRDKNHGKKV